MQIIHSTKWDSKLATGQVRLLGDLWFEALSTDASPIYWMPTFSTLQMIRHLHEVLRDIATGTLKTYHAKDLASQLVDRFNQKPWIINKFAVEWNLRSELENIKKNPDQSPARENLRLLLKAFIDKIERVDPIESQLDFIASLVQNTSTSYEVIARAVFEICNDLIEIGHSREFLHDWFLNTVLSSNGEPYIEHFRKGNGLGTKACQSYSVLFGTHATKFVTGNRQIRFFEGAPEEWFLPKDSRLFNWKNRFVVIKQITSLDWQAAIEQSEAIITRYLNSLLFEDLKFSRSVFESAIVRNEADQKLQYRNKRRKLNERSIQNALLFYELKDKKREYNESTYAELDRVMHLYEQSRNWDDFGRLISLWTSLEFLFGPLEESSVAAIQKWLPAYVVPQYARLLLLDLRFFMSRIEISWPENMIHELKAESKNNRIEFSDLQTLFDLCCEKDDSDNRLLSLFQDYPIMIRKMRKIRRLNHPFSSANNDSAIYQDICAFENLLKHDLQYAYRARNQIVHAAALNIVQLDRLVQRLNWMLCTVMDSLIYHFAQQPNLKLRDIHEDHIGTYQIWKQCLKSQSPVVPACEILNPFSGGR